MFKEIVSERRHERVRHLLIAELSSIFRQELNDPRVRGALVTDVVLSDDKKEAKVKVCRSLLGDGHEPSKLEQKELISGLQSSASRVFRLLKKKTDLKRVPFLRFYYDPSLAEASQVWNKFHDLEQQEKANGILEK